MIWTVSEPEQVNSEDQAIAAYRLATYARERPGEWVQTDELSATYAKWIRRGNAREFQPETEWQTSQKGGLLSVRYLGPGAVYRDVRVRGVGRDARRPGVDILTGHRERVS